MQSTQNTIKVEQNRARPVQLKFRVTEEERELIFTKMHKSNITNLAAYLRKMAIDDHIIEVDYTGLKEVCAQMQKIGTNVNQIAKRINITGSVYAQDMKKIEENVKQIWQLLRSNLSSHG